MKRIALSVFAAGAATVALSAPAQAAITIDTAHCVSVSDSLGCKFNGENLANTAQATTTQTLYNTHSPAYPDAPIDLSGLLGTNDGTGFGTITFDTASNLSGTWKTPGFSIQYLAVSAGNNTILYKLSGASSGNWSTTGLNNSHGDQQKLSHLAFFGVASAVPEPASWALMIVGFGVAGATMRRSKVKSAVSFA